MTAGDALTRALPLQAEAARLFAAGDHAQARTLSHEALELLRDNPPEDSPRLSYLWFSLGTVLEQTGAYAEAEGCGAASLKTIEALLPDRGGKSGELLRLRALGLLVTALRQLGQYAKGEPYALRQIELAAAMPDKPGESATAWNNLGMLCKYAGWFDRGAEAYANALAFAKRETNECEDLTATILHNVGGLAHARGRFAEGEEPARRAWEIRRSLLGEEHLSALADATAYAALLDGSKRYRESRPIYENALAIYERTLGPEHYEVAATLHNLALVENAEGHRDRALELARRSYTLKRNLLGAEHPDAALSAMNLASLLPVENRDQSRELLAGALAVFERALVADHPHLVRCRQLLGRIG